MTRLSFLYLVALAAVLHSVYGDLKLTIVRSIDITTQVPKYILNIDAVATAGSESEFIFPIAKTDAEHLAYITATDGASKKLNFGTTQNIIGGTKPDYVYYRITLSSPITPSASGKLRIEYVLTQTLTPLPAAITQAESQFVVWKGTASSISVYPVEKETTNVKVGSGKVVSYTQNVPSKETGGKVIFGPVANVAPYTVTPVAIHYENNAPFVVVTQLNRIIEVSHFGNVAIEDHVEVVHKGAELKGSFSRIDYQIDRRSKSPIVKVLKAILPVKARDIYYRDQIGNISTSSVRHTRDRVEVEMRPRFPLLGGWKTNYILGYNVPSSEFLHRSGNNFALQLPLIHPLFTDVVIEKANIQIILPETAHSIKVVKPFSIKQLPDSLHFTYLDTVGRPVINLEKENLVDFHSQPITIYYDFSYINLLREPVIVIAAFFAIFFVIIVVNRFDFSIQKKKD